MIGDIELIKENNVTFPEIRIELGEYKNGRRKKIRIHMDNLGLCTEKTFI